MTVAFIGTGLIGAGMIEAALERGENLVLWNRTRSKAERFAAHGARVMDTAQDAAAAADQIHIVLSDDAAVDEVLASITDQSSGKLVIDHSTTSPAGTRARAERCAEHGLRFLHAPVFMSPAMCRQARGLMLAAGPPGVFASAQPHLERMTTTVDYLGERPDLAAAFKLFGNAMIITITAGLADVFAMAKALQISPRDALSLFEKFNPAATLSYRGAAMAKADFTPSFELTMARKDVRLMLETAAGSEVELRVAPAIAQWMDELIAEGYGSEDMAVLGRSAVVSGGSRR